MREKIQKFGSFMSGMIMPNLGAFLAWGLLTALFIPTGWLPNEDLSSMVGPAIIYLLPILIAYTGGNMVHGRRGAVMGSIMAVGVIVGTSIPMFLGAMIVGPLAAWIIKKFDQAIEGKIKAGFEMLVNMFSAGIIGVLLMVIAYLVIGPAVTFLSDGIGNIVGWVVDNGLLFFVSILVEPAKVLFLNNAINHGVFTPLGANEVLEAGKSIFFMIETNPGPGLGILLAFWFAGKGLAKESAPGSIVIHFFGGIHEIYFPYILMKPKLILAAIAGGMTGVGLNSLFGNGLVAAPSPGSIFAYILVTPRGGLFTVLLAVLASAAVSFVVAYILLKADKDKEGDLEKATSEMEALKGKTSSVASTLKKAVNQYVIFACDAGMGSSAMGASLVRDKFKKAGLDIKVDNVAVRDLKDHKPTIVVTQKTFKDQVEKYAPGATIITVDNFINSPEYDKLVNSLK